MANYFIIGGDGQQYGPVSAEDLRRWIPENRVQAQTQAQLEGTTEWRTLAEIPEFAGAFPALTPPPLPAGAPAGQAKTSGMAITSLVLGMLGILTCGITVLLSAPAGLILGIVALKKIGKSQGQLCGKGLALAGIITSGVTIVLIPVFAALLLPALAAAKTKAQQINCVNNEKQLALGMIIYSSGHTNQLPPAATWCDAIGASPNILKCPAVNSTDSTSRCDYAFNSKLGGMDTSKVNPQTVMIFESDAGWNANGGRESLAANPRHLRGRIYVIAFVDGHVEAVSQSRLNTLRWDP